MVFGKNEYGNPVPRAFGIVLFMIFGAYASVALPAFAFDLTYFWMMDASYVAVSFILGMAQGAAFGYATYHACGLTMIIRKWKRHD